VLNTRIDEDNTRLVLYVACYVRVNPHTNPLLFSLYVQHPPLEWRGVRACSNRYVLATVVLTVFSVGVFLYGESIAPELKCVCSFLFFSCTAPAARVARSPVPTVKCSEQLCSHPHCESIAPELTCVLCFLFFVCTAPAARVVKSPGLFQPLRARNSCVNILLCRCLFIRGIYRPRAKVCMLISLLCMYSTRRSSGEESGLAPTVTCSEQGIAMSRSLGEKQKGQHRV